MTKMEKIASLIAAATSAAAQIDRQAALVEATAMKRAAKVSWEKLGVTADAIATATTAAETADAPAEKRRGRKASELRDQVLAFVKTAAVSTPKELVRAVAATFGLKYTQAYYLSILLPKKLAK